jgi:hypothetical protein
MRGKGKLRRSVRLAALTSDGLPVEGELLPILSHDEVTFVVLLDHFLENRVEHVRIEHGR